MRARDISLIIFVLLTACSSPENRRQNLPVDSSFVNCYADRLICTEESNLLRLDSARLNARLDSIGRIYGYSSGQVQQNIAGLQKNPDDWKTVYGRVVRRLEFLQRMESSQPR